jgi:hypothetical protein
VLAKKEKVSTILFLCFPPLENRYYDGSIRRSQIRSKGKGSGEEARGKRGREARGGKSGA